MLDEFKKLLPIPGTAVALAALTYKIGEYLNKTVSADVRTGVSLWIRGVNPVFDWHVAALELFQRLFGKKYLSVKCLSTTLTITVAFGVLFFLLFGSYEEPSSSADIAALEPNNVWRKWGWISLLLSLLSFNLLFDYLAVSKSRLLLGLSARLVNSIWLLGALLLADMVLSVCIVVSGLFVYSVLTSPAEYIADVSWGFETELISLALPLVHSVWMFLFVIAVLAARGIVWLGGRLSRLSKFLSDERIEKEPITLVGEFAAALLVITAVIILIVQLPFQGPRATTQPSSVSASEK
jgi:hypothetical protein